MSSRRTAPGRRPPARRGGLPVRAGSRVVAAGVLALLATLLLASPAAAADGDGGGGDGGRTVGVTGLTGPITPVLASHVRDTVTDAAAAGHEALVIELDTPGGLVTSMRDIVQELLSAPLPVIVYVAPPGADAASAGTFVTLAAHVAAMAPTTTIGAATPVDLQGGAVGDKVVNNAAAYARAVAEARGRSTEFAVSAVREGRAITAAEAVEAGAVDLTAPDLRTLLERVDGDTVTVRGRQVTLSTAEAAAVSLDMPLVRRVQQALANPELAFLFMSLGTLAVVYEVANPGLGAGGTLGAILLILAMFSLSVLPINLAGLALIVLAGVLFVVELFVPGLGVAAGGGAAALVVGGLLLVDDASGLELGWQVVAPTGVTLFVLVLLAGWMVTRTRGTPSRVASDVLIGRRARVHDADGPHGRVRLDGTWWRARRADDGPLADGDTVRVVDRDNLELWVEPVSSETPATTTDPDPD